MILPCKSTSVTSSSKKGQFGKNPTVDTSFLPDRDREELDRKEREELRQKWLKMQEAIKQEDIEITYSYWDGTGHRKEVTVRKSPPVYTYLLSRLSH
jgi:protein FAM50